MTLEDEELLVKICVELEQHIYLNGEIYETHSGTGLATYNSRKKKGRLAIETQSPLFQEFKKRVPADWKWRWVLACRMFDSQMK